MAGGHRGMRSRSPTSFASSPLGVHGRAPALGRAASAHRTGLRDASPPVEVSVVMPCLNEAESIAACIRKAQASMRELGIVGEIVVADNGSTDGSQRIARRLGARVVTVADRGYGSALSGGFATARGSFVVMGDADNSYDFGDLGPSRSCARGTTSSSGTGSGAGSMTERCPRSTDTWAIPSCPPLADCSFARPSATFTAGFARSEETRSSVSIFERQGWSSPARWW